MKRGFVITYDAVLALLIVMLSLGLVFSFTEQGRGKSVDEVKILQLSEDILLTMEKTGHLEKSMTNSTPVRQLIERTSENYCFEITLTDADTGVNKYSLKKYGCTSLADEYYVKRRTMVVEEGGGHNFYIAKIVGWYNE